MIDGTLRTPFFARSLTGRIIGMNGNFEWHNEIKGVMEINKDFKRERKARELGEDEIESSESDSEEEMEYPGNLQPDGKGIKLNLDAIYTRRAGRVARNMSFEVDFDYFYKHYWQKVHMKYNFSPLVCWTEISTHIKGSATSHLYPGSYLPRRVYLNLTSKNALLSEEIRSSIWSCCMEYERWKARNNGYDF
mmetsp:Transcript_26773/g.4803  ORF Transcript_26773/g.4803 Transcript_26773/m.4803 type:complete len:192 (+) Transcript_26773:1071-1646(+)